MDIREQLTGLLGHQGLMKGSDWQRKLEALRRQREAGEFEIDKVVPGEVIGDAESGFYLVHETFPLDRAQGAISLGAVLDVSGDHIALSAADDVLKEFDPRRALFVDTETSGLAGGAGTVAFLIGVGYFNEEGFRLDQCFMRDYDDEEQMLEYLAEIFRDKEAVVSYNGKSFDMPLLRTRFIQNRIPFRLKSDMHFDLLHAARRFWKRRLGACDLGNVERKILGIRREGDVPSHEIPQLWFDYLRTRDARPLARVFNHHKMDILSLVALTAWLSRCLAAPHGQGFEHNEDRLSLLRLHLRQRHYEEAVAGGVRLLENEKESELRRECLHLIVLASKRLGDWERAEEHLQLLVREHPSDLSARIELSKYYEHRARNFEEAERICAQALDWLETRNALGLAIERDLAALERLRHRLERLRRKRSGRGGASLP